MSIEFIAVNALTHRDELIQLNVEFLSSVFDGIEDYFGVPANQVVGVPASDYVPTVIDKVCGDPPPKGIFYLIKVDGSVAGMGGLRFISTGLAELKRIYVRPAYRGKKLGELLLDRILSDATAFGYEKICLDSAPFMKSAHRLYENAGFKDCDAYEGTEVPVEFRARWRFMERDLHNN